MPAVTGMLTEGKEEPVVPRERHGLYLRLMMEEARRANPTLDVPDADLTTGVSTPLPRGRGKNLTEQYAVTETLVNN